MNQINVNEKKVKVAISYKSDNFSPDPRSIEVKEFESLEEALSKITLVFGYTDFRVSTSPENSNIVGLDVDYDIQIIDEKESEE